MELLSAMLQLYTETLLKSKRVLFLSAKNKNLKKIVPLVESFSSGSE